jgi:hypothetical protein
MIGVLSKVERNGSRNTKTAPDFLDFLQKDEIKAVSSIKLTEGEM